MTSNFKCSALLAALTAVSFGCTENPAESTDTLPVIVTADVTETRTQYAASGGVKKTEWLLTDQIGINAGAQQNLRYDATAEGTTVNFIPAGEALATGQTCVYAYYPFCETSTGSENVVMLPDLAHQIYDPEDPGANDFLYASGEQKDGKVALQFHHAFSVVEIPLSILTAIGFENSGIEKIVLRRMNGGTLWTTGSQFDLTSQRIIVPGNGSPVHEITLETSRLDLSENGNQSLWITVPQFEAEQGERIAITAWIDGREFPLAEKQTPDNETGFRKGNLYLLDNGGTAVISLSAAGTLGDLVTPEQLKTFTSIKFVGPMNDDDAAMFGSKERADVDGCTDWLVEKLDLSDAAFENDVLKWGFNSLPHLRTLRLPSTLKKIYRAFDNCISLVEIDFGEDPQLMILGNGTYVDYIHYLYNQTIYCGAFSRCKSLQTIEIPASVTAIEGGAFYRSGLRSVTFAENSVIASLDPSQASADTGLGSSTSHNIGMFYGCAELETLEIPKSVIMITESAFKGWSGLKRLTIPETVEYIITDNLFSGCTSLEEVSLPSSVTAIGKGMFANCRSLKSFDLDGRYTQIGESAFSGCTSLETIDFDGVKEFGSNAFSQCGFTHIRIPDNMTEIPSGLFSSCEKLKDLDLNKTEIIGSTAFSRCDALESVTLPASVKLVQSSAFEYCENLKEVIVSGGNIEIGKYAFFSESLQTFYICREVCSLTSQERYYPSRVFNPDFHNFVFEEGSHCEEFGLCMGLNISEINLPPSVRKLGPYAFSECRNLTDIGHLLENIVEIGDYAFYRTNIYSAPIPEGVKRIGKGAFSQCPNLLRFSLPSTLTYLGSSAFANDPKLTTSTLNGGDLSIGGSLFANCPFITKIIVGSHITSLQQVEGHLLTTNIREFLFEDNSHCAMLSGSIFYYYSSINNHQLTTVTLPPSLTTIGDYVFQGWNQLTSIEIPENVVSIGQQAFYDCRQLKSLVIPAKVATIGARALTSLTECYFRSPTPPSFDISNKRPSPFDSDLQKIYVPAASIDAYKSAWAKWVSSEKIVGYDF